jgi:FtsZ-binding cell division protein ZapB
MLGLTAGGTDFCQALTVIIDDIGGHLPLDPTKQGVAFGHHANGHVHQQNLYSVVNGVVKFYYKYHLKKFGDSKAVLTAKISEFSEADIPDKLKTCRNSILTDYGVLFNITKDNRIVVDRTCQVGYEIGPDTIFRLASPDLQNKCRKVAPPQKSAHSPAKKKSSKKRTTTKVIPVSSKRNQPSPSKKRSIKKVKPLSRKKCQVAIDKAKDSPPRLKGKRSSTRQRRSPEWWSVESGNYGNSETENEESDDADSETENDESDDAVNAAHSPPQLKGGRPSMKTRRKYNGHRGDGRKEAETVQEVIDICSSSDEEDELMTKDVPMPACVASNVSAIEIAKMPANASSSALVNNSEENNIAEELETDEENDTETNLDFVAKSLEIENLNAKVLSLQNENESLQNENESLQNENESLQNELMGLRQELEQRKLFAL